MATIRDVAQLAGVSIATVSRVLNNSEKVLPETTKHVKAILKELNYVYNQPLSKRSTATGKKSLFAIILPNLVNPYFAELLDVVEQEAQHLERGLLVFNSRGDVQREVSLIEECHRYKVDGIFIVPCSRTSAHLTALPEQSIPLVVLTQLLETFTSVAVDHIEGGAQIAEHLVSMGHTEIGYFGSTDDVEEKFVGFRNKLVELGVHLKPDCVISTPALTAMELSCAFHGFLDQHPTIPFSAIFTFNDVAAQQVIEALQQRHISVPEQVMVVGFDNTLLSRVMNISSVAQPMREIGRLGCQEMVRLVTRNDTKVQHLTLTPRLVLRSSSVQVSTKRF